MPTRTCAPSSFEHDGLGRYGDPLGGLADVEAMARTSCHVKPGGLLFLGVPMKQEDRLYWNAPS